MATNTKQNSEEKAQESTNDIPKVEPIAARYNKSINICNKCGEKAHSDFVNKGGKMVQKKICPQNNKNCTFIK